MCDWQAVQHTNIITALQRRIGSLRAFQRPIRLVGDYGIDLRIDAINLIKVLLHDLSAGKFFAADALRQFHSGHEIDVGIGHLVAPSK